MSPAHAIILPTHACVRRFIESAGRMEIVDYDLVEIMVVVCDVLSERDLMSQRISTTLAAYRIEEHQGQDGLVLVNAMYTLINEVYGIIERLGLRSPDGRFYYVFDDWVTGSYDMMMTLRP